MARLSSVRCLVFDLDGTLIDSARDLATAVNEMLQGLAPGTAALSGENVRCFIGDGARSLVARSLEARALEVALERALPIFLEAYGRHLLDATQLYPGVRETLVALRPAHTLAVLSNKPGRMSRTILGGLGVADHFARIYGGDDVPKKPDPAGLVQLIGELGASAGETLMVGDSANDIRTGRAAGARTVGVSYGYDRAGVARERPELLVADLRELVGLLR